MQYNVVSLNKIFLCYSFAKEYLFELYMKGGNVHVHPLVVI